jgi:NADPH-dependent ferric siderophore reductase
MSFIKARVGSRRFVTPGMVRVTLAGPEVEAFEDTGVSDEFVRIFFPDPATGHLPIPQEDDAGRAVFPDGIKEPHNEYYSIRRIDKSAREIDIDFVVHEGGLASEWAQKTQPGDCIVLGKGRFCYEPPEGMQWQVLLADATGLPALSRIAEETPRDIRTIAVVEIADAAHRQDLDIGDHVELRWLYGSGNGVGPSNLLSSLRAMTLPQGEGYIWMAGEMQASRGIRRYLRGELGLTGRDFSVVRYWLDNKEAWRARWDGLDPAVRQQIEALWDQERDPDEISDMWHNMLEKHGL